MKTRDKAILFFLRAKQKRAQDSITLSRGEKKKMYGIEIKKVPIGRYLDMTKRMPLLLYEALDEAFPLMTPLEVLNALSDMEVGTQKAHETLRKLFQVVPLKIVEALCEILDTDKEYVMKHLTPHAFTQVLLAFWEMNDYTDFFLNVQKICNLTGMKKTNTGSKNGSCVPT